MKKIKALKKNNSLILLVLSLIFAFVMGVLTSGVHNNAYALSTDNRADINENTGYSLYIPLNNVVGYAISGQTYPKNELEYWQRSDKKITVVFRFPEVLVDKNAVLAYTIVPMNCPSYFWGGEKWVVNDNVGINIREEYYNIFKDKKVTKFKMTILLDKQEYHLYASKPTTKLDKTERDVFSLSGIRVDDNNTRPDYAPDDLNPLGDNGGTFQYNQSGTSKTVLQKISDFLNISEKH